MHNVAKHAGATTVTIEMKRDGETIRLLVEDDGVGIPAKPTAGRQTFGIAGMYERVGNLSEEDSNVITRQGHAHRSKCTRIESARGQQP